MFNRKECKKTARKILREHYGLFVFLCLIAAVIGTSYGSSYTSLRDTISERIVVEPKGDSENHQLKWQLNEVISTAIENKKASEKEASQLVKDEKKEKPAYIGKHIEMGHYKGVLAGVRNQVVSGAFVIAIVSAMASTLGSVPAALVLFCFVAFALFASVWMFFINVYRVIYARMFLEGRIYKKVPIQRFAFLIYVKKWWKASLTMMLKEIYHNLWLLTVIGGIIKSFSYFAVPYIVAENPDISARKAIRLSRDMMNGHKWECFKLRMSFWGWMALDVVTVGLSGIFYSNPYMEAALCEYYVYIRELAKEKQIEGIDALNDNYLYELPSRETLTEVYGTIEQYAIEEEEEKYSYKNIFSNLFGVYLFSKKYEKEKGLQEKKRKYQSVKYILNQEEYATKLLPISETRRRNILEYLGYDRKYSLWTIIWFFVFFSFVGWMWEVSLHLIQNGVFVNRGTLQGPYLPIYGTGGVIILLILYRLRKNPLLEFSGAIVLCGLVEYFSGFMLERIYHGQKWWCYNGYFLNIDGRVCAEGLLVFGIGGMIVVYLLAPIFDNIVKKIPYKIVVIVSIVFLLIMGADATYSSVHPNTGYGITDYKTE